MPLAARLGEHMLTHFYSRCHMSCLGCRGPAAEGIIVHMFTYGAPRVGNKVQCSNHDLCVSVKLATKAFGFTLNTVFTWCAKWACSTAHYRYCAARSLDAASRAPQEQQVAADYPVACLRCALQAFADEFNKRLQGRSWRITNMSDIVPRWVLRCCFVQPFTDLDTQCAVLCDSALP